MMITIIQALSSKSAACIDGDGDGDSNLPLMVVCAVFNVVFLAWSPRVPSISIHQLCRDVT